MPKAMHKQQTVQSSPLHQLSPPALRIAVSSTMFKANVLSPGLMLLVSAPTRALLRSQAQRASHRLAGRLLGCVQARQIYRRWQHGTQTFAQRRRLRLQPLGLPARRPPGRAPRAQGQQVVRAGAAARRVRRIKLGTLSFPGAFQIQNQRAETNILTRLQSHVKWVIMLVVLVVVIVGGWIAACLFRRRYLKRKEREFELRPPVVAWGPHQHQSSTGGYSYGDGIVDANGRPMGRGTPRAAETGQLGGHHKEMRAEATPAITAKEESGRGWLKKSRR